MASVMGLGLVCGTAAAAAGVTPQKIKKPAVKASGTPAPKSTIKDNSVEKSRTFDEWIAGMMKPRPYPKKTIVRIDEHFARPHKAVPWKFRIVKEEGDTVWLQPLPPEDPGSPLHELWLQEQERQAVIAHQLENPEKVKLLDFDEVMAPLPFQDAVHFEILRDGLPQQGQWRNNFAVADFNEDGKLDLLLPPPREGEFRAPVILLGDGEGSFRQWRNLKWPGKVPFDYGGVATGDFDRDGHLDVVVAIHFKGQYVLYGDGRGDFSRFKELPTPDDDIHSQAAAVADFNGDGWDDVAFVAEVSYNIKTSEALTVPSVWVLENRSGKGWKVHVKGLPAKVMGVKLSSPDLNGDGKPDLLVSSNAQDWRNLVFFNFVGKALGKAPGKAAGWNWATNRVDEVLAGALHFNVVPEWGKKTQVLAVFQQFQLAPKTEREAGGKTRARSGLVRYTVHPNGAIDTEVLEMDQTEEKTNPWWRLATGDINGDRQPDAVLLRHDGSFKVLLGDGEGGYVEEKSPELKPIGRPYDVEIRDVDGDGKGEVIVMTAQTKELAGGMEILRVSTGPVPVSSKPK